MLLRWLVGNWVQNQGRGLIQEKLKAHVAGEGEPIHAPETLEVACFFALGIESGGLYDLLETPETIQHPDFVEHLGLLDGRLIALVETGVGGKKARRTTEQYIALRKPQWIVSCGFAGGLAEPVKKGQVVMANAVVRAEREELVIPFSMTAEQAASQPGLHVGRLLTVDKIVRTPDQKRQLGDLHGAIAVDMETYATADACVAQKTRFLSVRVITDAVDDELPKNLERLVEQNSTAKMIGAAAAAIINRPSSVQDMWRLRETAMKASDRLARFLQGVVPQLK
ncbi:phosphorylase family protein [Blastopirellula marina]|uniref:Pfs protein n=1 Tax=Blastopirellula marina DSM 3645 TaxID=314230 RepID=A3ZZL2_9BACT|nr:Pfs protein [Blastopirellula marina]EAQ77996.1 Pfs protein [Blastopirellula marina DSM 3645]